MLAPPIQRHPCGPLLPPPPCRSNSTQLLAVGVCLDKNNTTGAPIPINCPATRNWNLPDVPGQECGMEVTIPQGVVRAAGGLPAVAGPRISTHGAHLGTPADPPPHRHRHCPLPQMPLGCKQPVSPCNSVPSLPSGAGWGLPLACAGTCLWHSAPCHVAWSACCCALTNIPPPPHSPAPAPRPPADCSKVEVMASDYPVSQFKADYGMSWDRINWCVGCCHVLPPCSAPHAGAAARTPYSTCCCGQNHLALAASHTRIPQVEPSVLWRGHHPEGCNRVPQER